LKNKKEICAGFQEAVCDVLVQKTLSAAKRSGRTSVVVGGGVSANSRLRKLLGEAGQKQGLKVVFPSLSLCQDNAAMIAALGASLYKEGRRDGFDLAAYPKFSDGNKTRRI
jgi:N6-L-threonylcarbamoyladenine synthase